jgi:FMN phosphatase YigB (HAD superfamily)
MVGDSIRTDVAGAAAAGLESVWLADSRSRSPDVTPDYAIDSLAELRVPPWHGD